MSHPDQGMIKLKIVNMEKANIKLLTLNPDNIVEGEDKTGPAPHEMKPILVNPDGGDDEEDTVDDEGDDT